MSARISARYMASSIIDTFCSRFISFLALAAACIPVMPSKPSLISRPFFTVKPLPGERIIFFIGHKDTVSHNQDDQQPDVGYSRPGLGDTRSNWVTPPDSRGRPPTETGLLACPPPAVFAAAPQFFSVFPCALIARAQPRAPR